MIYAASSNKRFSLSLYSIGRPVQETKDISKCHPVQHPKWGLFRHLRQVGIQGRICLSSIGTTAVGVGEDSFLLAVEVPKPAFLYSDVELYEVSQGEDQGQPLPEAKEKRQLDPCPGHARS